MNCKIYDQNSSFHIKMLNKPQLFHIIWYYHGLFFFQTKYPRTQNELHCSLNLWVPHGISARFFCVFFLMLLLRVVQILAGFLGQIERLCGIVSSGVQFLFWLIFLVFSIVPFYTKIILKVSSFLKHVTGYDKQLILVDVYAKFMGQINIQEHEKNRRKQTMHAIGHWVLKCEILWKK